MAPEGKVFALGLVVVGCRLQKVSRDLQASLSQKYMLVVWDARFQRASYTCETCSSTCAKVNWKLSCFGDVSCVGFETGIERGVIWEGKIGLRGSG